MATQGPRLEQLEKSAKAAVRPGAGGRTPPEILDLDMRIARDGTWYYRGTPIRRIELAKLFATVLRREEDGSYWLVTPVERGRVDVEDAPFVAVEVVQEGAGADATLRFRTNLDQWVTADAEHPIRVAVDPETGEPAPYVLVRPGLEALIARAVFYELVDMADAAQGAAADEGRAGGELGLWSAGRYFALGRVDGGE